MVRPRMHPSKRPFNVAFISAGSRQLFVGPASSGSSEQMNVRASTRATSFGSLRARKLYGRCSAFSRMRVPLATISLVRVSNSRGVPSHQTMSSGRVRREMRSTHSISRALAPTGGRWARAPWSVSGSVRLAEVMVMGSVLTVAELMVLLN